MTPRAAKLAAALICNFNDAPLTHLLREPGDVIFIPPGPECPHQIINTSDAPLKVLSVSTMETPEICEVPRFRQVPGRRQPAIGRTVRGDRSPRRGPRRLGW